MILNHICEMRRRSTLMGFLGVMLGYAMFIAMVAEIPIALLHVLKLAPAIIGPLKFAIESGYVALACFSAVLLIADERGLREE